MNVSKSAKNFLKKNKGDPKVRKFLNKGGRKGAEKDFNLILKRAAKLAY